MSSSTRNKLKYISPAKEEFSNLGAEIIHIHEQNETNSSEISKLQDKVDNLDPSSNVEINNRLNKIDGEIVEVKDDIETLEKKVGNLSDNNMNTGYEKVSINKEYEYDGDGRIVKEISTGDVERVVVYTYNTDDVVTSEVIYEKGEEVGRKEYYYNLDGDIYKVKSTNGDTVNIAVMEFALKELGDRLEKIENSDLVSLSQVLSGEDAKKLIKAVQDLSVKVSAVDNLLPENITSLIEIPRIVERLDELEKKVNRQHVKHKFIVYSYTNQYEIPADVSEESSVFLEGLLLDYGDDYTIEDGFMTFNIQLIDGFEVQCKY